MNRSYLADLIVGVHFLYVGFVVLGFVAVLAGGWRGWGWVRNRYFRLAHLAAITVVAGEAVLGIACPLTVWEARLRSSADEGTFVGRLLHRLLFVDLPPAVFTAGYVSFAILVLITLWWIPPQWRTTRQHALRIHGPVSLGPAVSGRDAAEG